MASEMTAAKMALLMKLANKEASRRQRRQIITDDHRHDRDGIHAARPSSVTIEDVEAVEEENRQLESMLREERAGNDVEWETVRRVSVHSWSQQKFARLMAAKLRTWHHWKESTLPS